MTGLRLATLYVVFAIAATIVNLAVQRAVLAYSETMPFFLTAMVAGTLAGLVLKYVLDKHWIFDDRSSGMGSHSRKFSLYTLMGVATTLIFWGTETAFWLVWQTQAMRELGAVIGLAIGYAVKYQLDRRFVFDPPTLAEPGR